MKNNKCSCPRCGGFLETLQSYAHCASCLYFEDYWFDSESSFIQAMKAEKELSNLEKTESHSQDEEVDEKECA